MATTLQRSTSPPRGGSAVERWLITLGAGLLVGLYVLGKFWPQLTFSPVGSAWFGDALIFLAAAGLLGLMLLGPARSRTTPRRRLALIALRLAVVLLVLLLMLRPALVYSSFSQRTATIALLVDTSASMKSADASGQSRYERLRDVLRQAEGALGDLGEKIIIKVYAFDADPKELTFSSGRVTLPDAADGDQTAIGWCLGEVLKREAGQRLKAVVLLSDGTQRALPPKQLEDPTAVAQRMKDRGVPIFGVIFGRTDIIPRDLVLESLKANDSVHAKNRLAITGEARSIGFPDPSLPVQLLWEKSPGKMELVETTQLRPRANGELTSFDLSYAHDTPGLYKMILRLPKREGEFDNSNNEQATIVRVTKGGLAALYLEGAVRVESRNILRSLGSSQNIDVDFLRLDAQHPERRPAAAAQTLADALKPGSKYDVFILGDLAASAFRPGQGDQKSELELLRQRVYDGAGLMMLGGLHSFGPGDFGMRKNKDVPEPMEDVLPVVMTDRDHQDFNAKLRTDKHLMGKVKIRPAAGNSLTLLTTPEKNAALWDSLPPLLDGANKLENNGGVVLLEDTAGNPILIAKAAGLGKGRSLAFAGDSTWRWVSHGFEEPHKRFWRQLVLWLAGKDQDKDGPVWVTAKDRHVFVGQAIDLAAGARAEGKPLADFELTAEVIRRDEGFQESVAEELRFNRQADQRSTSFKPTQPGDYLVRVEAIQAGKSLGKAEERFLVREPKQLELQNPISDLPTMQRMAQETGGQVVSPGEFDKVLDRLRLIPQELQDEVRTVSSLWDPLKAGPLARLGINLSLAALCGFAIAVLLSVEWFCRKRWGLV